MAYDREAGRMRQRMVKNYEGRRLRMYHTRRVVPFKVAPGNARGDHSMSRPEGEALWHWIMTFRKFMHKRR